MANERGQDRVERTIIERDSGGWAVSLIVIIVLIAAGFFLWTRHGGTATPDTNINVNVPAPDVNVPGPGGSY